MDRYDRQTRLWSTSGQHSLENAKVAFFGISLVIAEILKNLSSAGLGELIIITNDREEANSFSVPVYGDMKSLGNQIKTSPVIPNDIDLIVTTHNCDKFEQLLLFNVPIVIVGSSFMQGFVAIETGNHSLFVLQPHPPAGLVDLRFKRLWPELEAFCDSFDLKSMNDTDHSHVPFGVLLAKASKESESFEETKQNLLNMRRYSSEENFEEALRNIYRMKQPAVPDGISSLIDTCNNGLILSSEINQEPFWQHVKALQRFIETNHCLPVSGEIPDMFSSSPHYTRLKAIYKEKQSKDLKEFKKYLSTEQNPPSDSFTETFCRNSRYVQAILPSSFSPSKPRIWNEEFISNFNDNKPEIIPVCSIIGGIAAQEVSKLIMRQYTPMVSLLTYDAVTNKTEVFKCGARIIN